MDFGPILHTPVNLEEGEAILQLRSLPRTSSSFGQGEVRVAPRSEPLGQTEAFSKMQRVRTIISLKPLENNAEIL